MEGAHILASSVEQASHIHDRVYFEGAPIPQASDLSYSPPDLPLGKLLLDGQLMLHLNIELQSFQLHPMLVMFSGLA